MARSAVSAPGVLSTRGPVSVNVLPEYQRAANAELVRRAAKAALAAAQADAGRLSVVVADDDTVRALNTRYRGVDEVTDVLSFSWANSGHWEGGGAGPATAPAEGFPRFRGGQRELGEVVIAYPQAKRQAREFGHATRDELALLVVHGVLHVLGYDHEKPGDEAVMKALESRALASLGIQRTLLERSGRGG